MLHALYSLEKKIQSFTYFYSLNPKKIRPTLPTEFASNYLHLLKTEELKNTFIQSIENLYLSQIDNFPLNIFWDFDSLIHQIFLCESTQKMKVYVRRLCQLNEIFGNKGKINFSYSHDFIYGFDWIRWVKKDYEKRKFIAPFDPVFLSYLEKRARELKDLIDKNDKKYGRLPANEARNPFTFMRTPEEEIRLHLGLAEDQKIPVPAWKTSFPLNIPFEIDLTAAREAYSQKIGILKSPSQ